MLLKDQLLGGLLVTNQAVAALERKPSATLNPVSDRLHGYHGCHGCHRPCRRSQRGFDLVFQHPSRYYRYTKILHL